MSNSPLKVALNGVNHLTLLIGRACSLKDNPVLGIYDPDSQKALRGALFLGVSAMASPTQLLAGKPDVLICSVPFPEESVDLKLVINLYDQADSNKEASHCWARQRKQLTEGIPEQITSELPDLDFELTGDDENCRATADFFTELGFSVAASP